MKFLDTVKKMTFTNAHGEVNFFRIDDGHLDTTGFKEFAPDKDGFIVGHSEQGHNHVLERGDVEMKYIDHEGMQVLYAIVKEPVKLKQSAGHPHAEQTIQPGEYVVTNNVEYNPFTEQVRRVAD